MSDSSDKLIGQFISLEDLQAFAKAQQKTLITLTKKLKNSEDEINHLKKLLEGAVPVIKPATKIDFSSNDEESIAREQLSLLKNMSATRELNMEETRRVEIYSKILIAMKDKPKTIEIQTKQLSNEQLMAAISESNNSDVRDDQH